MKAILAALILSASLRAQTPAPLAISEPRLTTPTLADFTGVTYSPTLTIFVGVKNPGVGITYTVTCVIATAKNSYSLAGQVVPPIPPAVMSLTNLSTTMMVGDTLLPGIPGAAVCQAYIPITGPTGIATLVKVN